jgi:hypothetical protein
MTYHNVVRVAVKDYAVATEHGHSADGGTQWVHSTAILAYLLTLNR